MEIERRKASPRKTKRLPVTFSGGSIEQNGTSSNFSASGVFIRSRKPLDPGTPIRIVVTLNEHQKIELMGIVVWAIKTGMAGFKDGMGIKLTTISKSYKDFIEQLG